MECREFRRGRNELSSLIMSTDFSWFELGVRADTEPLRRSKTAVPAIIVVRVVDRNSFEMCR